MAVACGGSSAEHALPPEAAHAPHVDDDGWTRWELGARWPAAPTRTSAPLPHASEALADLLAMREANTLRGVPDPRGATLHDVELTERLPSAPERTVTRRLLVVPESVAGVRFAIDGALLVPLTGIGPEHDLFRDCDRALDRLEEGGPLVDAEHLCPLRSAWLVLLDRGREDLVLRWLANPNARSAEGFAAGDRASELGRRAAAHFAHGDDGAAIADLEARAEVERIRSSSRKRSITMIG